MCILIENIAFLNHSYSLTANIPGGEKPFFSLKHPLGLFSSSSSSSSPFGKGVGRGGGCYLKKKNDLSKPLPYLKKSSQPSWMMDGSSCRERKFSLTVLTGFLVLTSSRIRVFSFKPGALSTGKGLLSPAWEERERWSNRAKKRATGARHAGGRELLEGMASGKAQSTLIKSLWFKPLFLQGLAGD